MSGMDISADVQPPFSFTDTAASQVKKLVEEQGNPNLALRIFITGGGCSGFQYGFEFDETVNDDDFKIEKDGVTCVIDAMSLQYMNGAEVGFQEDLTGARFVVSNPSASTTCGCGASFSP